MNTLTKSQLINLLCNAYGFVDKHGVLFTPTVLTPNDEFELRCGNDVTLLFSFDNATFVNGTAVFETPDGDTESFTVVIAATDAFVQDYQSITEALFS